MPDPQLFIANLRLLNDVLASSSLKDRYQLFGGLLLGMVREGRPLAHDPDADFYYREEHQPSMDASIPDLVRAGFHKTRHYFTNDGRLAEYVFQKDGATFDFLCFRPTGDEFLTYHVFTGGKRPQQIEKRYPDVPYVHRTFLDRTWRVPEDPDTVLTFAYGDWRTPDPGYDYAKARDVVGREDWIHKWKREWRHPWSPRTLLKRLGQTVSRRRFRPS